MVRGYGVSRPILKRSKQMQGFIITNIALERSLRLTNTIPRNATNVRFVVSVPGGGDYSNMDLSIGQGADDVQLQVLYDLVPGGCASGGCALHAARLRGYQPG